MSDPHTPSLPLRLNRPYWSDMVDAEGRLVARVQSEAWGDFVCSAVNSQAADKALIGELVEALEFYARREHWMTLTDEPDSARKLFVAHGPFPSEEAWSVAEAAIMKARAP